MWTTQLVRNLHLFVSPHPPGNFWWEVVPRREWIRGVTFGCHRWEAMACDGAGHGQGAVAPQTRVAGTQSPQAQLHSMESVSQGLCLWLSASSLRAAPVR